MPVPSSSFRARTVRARKDDEGTGIHGTDRRVDDRVHSPPPGPPGGARAQPPGARQVAQPLTVRSPRAVHAPVPAARGSARYGYLLKIAATAASILFSASMPLTPYRLCSTEACHSGCRLFAS